MSFLRTITLGAVATAVLGLATPGFADEVTKTTTTRTSDTAVVVAPVAPRATDVVVDDAAGTGCSTKKVTKVDGDTGDTVKKTSTDC